MTNTYWNSNGKYQAVAAILSDKIPTEGSVVDPKKNKALEKFCKAGNCYYDLYNNGLCNRMQEFNGTFKIAASRYRFFGHYAQDFRPALYERTELKMDEIVMAAGYEQGLALYFEVAL